LEETIGAELARAGPFVAIGKPGERLPQIGAHRLYVDGLIVIRSPAAHESDYEAALRVATFLMGREPEQGTRG
jgi:hypothetical protein